MQLMFFYLEKLWRDWAKYWIYADETASWDTSKISIGIQKKSAGTGGAVCKGATPSVEQPGGRGFKSRLRSLLD
jgi:hypothetical protein